MRWVIAVVVASSSLAVAKPLPKGVQVVFDKDKLWFVDNGTKVPLWTSGSSRDARAYSNFKGATLSDDGRTVVVKVDDCRGDGEPAEVGLDELEARVENLRGMALHLKKKYADAIAHFAKATSIDPGTPMYATNLLSAQAMAGKLDDADKTLASEGARNVPWFTWRLAVDSDLKALRGRASTKPFITAKPTKLAYKAWDKTIAVSPLGYVVTSDDLLLGMGPSVEMFTIYDLKTSANVLEFAINDGCLEDAQEASAMGGGACTKQELAQKAAHARDASELLGSLGFTEERVTWVDHPEIDEKTGAFASPDKSIRLTFKPDNVKFTDNKLTITRGKASATVSSGSDEAPYRIGFGTTVLVLQYRSPWGCGGMDSMRFTSAVYRLP
jgi:hypothetical protein